MDEHVGSNENFIHFPGKKRTFGSFDKLFRNPEPGVGILKANGAWLGL